MPNERDVFHVVRVHPTEECSSLFAKLMEESDKGELMGAVIVALKRHEKPGDRRQYRQFTIALCGLPARDPRAAAQMAGDSWWLLQHAAHKESGLI